MPVATVCVRLRSHRSFLRRKIMQVGEPRAGLCPNGLCYGRSCAAPDNTRLECMIPVSQPPNWVLLKGVIF